MDRNRFDALAKLLATTGSRRVTLGALLSVGLLGQDPAVFAKRGKGGKGQGNGKDKGKGKDTGHGGQGVQGEGRPGAKHKQHHKHKQTQRQRRKKRDRQDRHQDRGGKQKREVCCGATKQCAPPQPGSNRAECDFGQQSFVGEDLNGSNFRQIAGGDANFDETDNHGSVFAAACLRRATFRGANLAGATWDGACLFAVDFTDADLGDADALDDAVLCATILPDGTRNDRDCDRSGSFSCCLPPPGGGGVIRPDCDTSGCDRDVCSCFPRDKCCPNQLYVCSSETVYSTCCLPDCKGRQCGWGGCGDKDRYSAPPPCGSCQGCQECDAVHGICVNHCTRSCCPTGCCASDGTCQPGRANDSCGTDGDACQACPAGQACVDGRCVCTPQSCPNGCCADGPGNPGECRPGNRIGNCGTGGGHCAACTQTQTCQAGQCVGCNGNCTCAGQTWCVTPNAPNVTCGKDHEGIPCICLVSRTGQPFCSAGIRSQPICATDADCAAHIPGSICVDYSPNSEWCVPTANFCADPCL
jgi:hypothetical protein